MILRKILIVQTAFIGDVILATGLIEKLKKYYPQAKIDFLLRKGNESILKGHPLVNQTIIWDKKKEKYSGLLQLIGVIRKENYDLLVNLQRFASMGLLTALSSAKQTIGFDKNPLSVFFTRRFPHKIDEGKHEIERNHSLIVHLTDTMPNKPTLYPGKQEYEAVISLQQVPYICIAPTSVWFTKQFPSGKWIELVQQLPSHYHIYLLGSPADEEDCRHIQETAGRKAVTNLAGKLSLLASAALMKDAVMNYVNDSAPMHLASAMNAPTCAVYCSTVPTFGFGPLADRSFIVELIEPLYCRPCGLHGYKACPEGHFKCAKDISILQLTRAISNN